MNLLGSKFDCKNNPVSKKTHLCYNQTDYDGMRIFVKVQQSCPWFGLTHWLGWIGLGWVEIFQFLVGWVGSTTPKVLKI